MRVEAPRLAGDDEPGRALDRVVGGAQLGEQLLDLGERGVRALPRHGAPLDQRAGRAGQHERRVAAGGDGGHQRGAALAELGVALLDGHEQPAEVGDGVDPELGLRRVRGPAGEGDLDQGVAAQALGEGQPGRLAHDGDVRVHPEAGQGGEHGLGPRAGVLLVGDEREHHPAGRAGAGELLGGDDHRRDAALHVARAAAAEAVGLDGRGERVGHALDADGVEVAGEHDGGAGGRVRFAGRSPPGSGGRRARGGDDVGREPAALQPVRGGARRWLPHRRRRGTRPGFTESMATSSVVSATAAAPRSTAAAASTSAARSAEGCRAHRVRGNPSGCARRRGGRGAVRLDVGAVVGGHPATLRRAPCRRARRRGRCTPTARWADPGGAGGCTPSRPVGRFAVTAAVPRVDLLVDSGPAATVAAAACG